MDSVGIFYLGLLAGMVSVAVVVTIWDYVNERRSR